MKLKNSLIIQLVNTGLPNTTEHDVPARDAYKASKFRREVVKAYQDLAKREEELKAEAGEDEERLKALREEMLNDETEISVTPMPYESFHALAKENRAVRMFGQDGKLIGIFDPFRAFETDLEGILWEAPAE